MREREDSLKTEKKKKTCDGRTFTVNKRRRMVEGGEEKARQEKENEGRRKEGYLPCRKMAFFSGSINNKQGC